jgi:hypothetical protein
MAAMLSFTDEQARLLINLRTRYDLWMNAEQALAAMPYDLRRKLISGNYYLYEIFDRGGNGKSRGRWTDEAAHQLEDYWSAKAREKERRDNGRVLLDESARLYRALRLPLLSRDAGPILREADRRQLLGSDLLVVGTKMPCWPFRIEILLRVGSSKILYGLTSKRTGQRDGLPRLALLHPK